ncbi:putative amidophosphoribosyltransferase [Catalinimonas alkaloidigena]|jgi:predicted amidophosphoribosyltransferase|uniref:hypothetical protein n=1 Tax=Catalinimonas TaxID=1522128 RepID=UPI0024063A57|nr:hypothetical protein [Catalinimonas alkaloidigena]MDF9799093.1 putative amidophosphoribosyltransferase [Catalinimonas alkaloidigena]
MNCTQCQRNTQADWNYCPDCGQAITEVSENDASQHETIQRLADPDDFPMGFHPQLYDL